MAPLLMARPRISVSLPPFWPILSSLCIHKDHTPNSGMQLGVRLIAYIDDFLLLAPSKEEVSIQAHLMTTLLQALGFSVNNEKSILTPCQEIEFLGVMIQSHSPALHLPQHKLQVFKSRAQQLLNKNATHQTITWHNSSEQPMLQQWQYHQPRFSTGLCSCANTISKSRRGAKQPCSPVRQRQGGIELVDRANQLMEPLGPSSSNQLDKVTSDSLTWGWGTVCNSVTTGDPGPKTKLPFTSITCRC